MTRLEIEKCNDIDELKRLCKEQHRQLSFVSETLVSESKMHITSKMAVENIRDYLFKHQWDLEIR